MVKVKKIFFYSRKIFYCKDNQCGWIKHESEKKQRKIFEETLKELTVEDISRFPFQKKRAKITYAQKLKVSKKLKIDFYISKRSSALSEKEDSKKKKEEISWSCLVNGN